MGHWGPRPPRSEGLPRKPARGRGQREGRTSQQLSTGTHHFWGLLGVRTHALLRSAETSSRGDNLGLSFKKYKPALDSQLSWLEQCPEHQGCRFDP